MVENPFNVASAEYAQVRPAYPQSVVELLAQGATDVADIGAGSGKMTLLLAAKGLRVSAVEPAAAMREQLEVALKTEQKSGRICSENLSHASPIIHDDTRNSTEKSLENRQGRRGLVNVYAGSAEETGMPSASVDVAVFAQSWHWVEPNAASVEAARILRPDGRIAAVWNQLDVRIPWVKRLTRIMRSGDVHRPDRPPAFHHELFSTPHLELCEWTDRMTPEQVMALGRTRSSWLRQDQAGRERMQNNLRWYLYEHLGYDQDKLVNLPYVTLVWIAHRRRTELGS